MNEILLTAAQFLMAVALLVGLRLGPRGAILLFGFFVGQFFTPAVLATVSAFLPFKIGKESIHLSISVLYAMVSIYLLVKNRTAVAVVASGLAERGCGRKTSAGARAREIICISSAR